MTIDTSRVEEQWVDLINARTTPEEAGPLLAESVQELDAYLDGHQTARNDTLAIMARHLATPITDRTWLIVDNALRDLIGVRSAYLVAWLFVDDNPTSRVDEIARVATPRAMDYLRSILAFHGDELARALALANGPVDDWRTVYREVNYDQVTNRLSVRLRVLKLNNELVVIEGGPDSILNFARLVLSALNAVGSAEAFSPRTADWFLEEAVSLVDALRARDETMGPQLPPSDEDGARETGDDRPPEGLPLLAEDV